MTSAIVTEPHDSLFRRSAIEHYLATDERGEVIRTSPPWTWTIVGVMAAAILAALLLSVVTRIEITDRATGVLRPKGGVRTLVAQTGGVVVQVEAKSGDRVPAGRIVARLASAELEAELLEADRALRVLRSDAAAHLEEQARMFDQQESSLRTRLSMLREVIGSQEESVQTFERRLQRSEELQKSGLISAASADDARENLSQSRRMLSASRQNLSQATQELAALQARRQTEVWQGQETLRNAQTRRDGLALLVHRTEIRAPVVGDLEAMDVKAGDVVQPGQLIARLVPRGVDFQVTSFVPEKDRPFIKPRDRVKLELDQFPESEYGSLEGRILRVGDDLASLQELREAMGQETQSTGATYRVDIDVLPSASVRFRQVPLRTGMMMTVRYTLRRERPIALFFAPVRRWLKS